MAEDVIHRSIQERTRRFVFFTDFIREASGTVSNDLGVSASGGSASSTFATDAANRVGIGGITTLTSATGRGSMSSNASAVRFGGGSWVYEADIKITSLSTSGERFANIIGFYDTVTAVDQTDGVYFLYDEGGVSTGSAASANWQIVCVSNSVRTFTTTSTAIVADTWTRLRIEVNAAGTSVTFYVNGTSVGTITTNIPTGSGRECGFGNMMIKSVGTTARTMAIDYMLVYSLFTTAR